MPDDEPKIVQGWAVKLAGGRFVVEVGEDVTETVIWDIALGYPNEHEIRLEKLRGGRAFRFRLLEI